MQRFTIELTPNKKEEKPIFRITLKGSLLTSAFVIVSNFLGLTGGAIIYGAPAGEVIEFLVKIWSASILADLVFVAGSVVATILVFKVARRKNTPMSVGLSFLLNWFVYLASFLALPHDFDSLSGQAIPEAAGFVLRWGWLGLVFAALAPVMAAGRPHFRHIRRHPSSIANEESTQES